jgi:hypothetical protein
MFYASERGVYVPTYELVFVVEDDDASVSEAA